MIYFAYAGHLARDRKASLAQLPADLAVPDRVALDCCATGILKPLTGVLPSFGFSDDGSMRVYRIKTVAGRRHHVAQMFFWFAVVPFLIWASMIFGLFGMASLAGLVHR